MKRSLHRWMTDVRVLAVALVACAGLGCSGPTPIAPVVDQTATLQQGATSAAREIQAAARRLPIGKLTYPPGTIGGVDTLPPAPQWYTVASRLVMPLAGGVVNGSRYKVIVPPLALSQTTTISIREHSPNVLDFELLPHGTQFLLPVTVDVDYSGTSLDPASPDYVGGLPILLWLNPSTGHWELVVGVNNPLTKTYTVLLTHFSRYAVGRVQGTAEW